MEPSVLLLLAFFAGFLLLLVRGYPKARGHLPPGPRPLPLLGNLLQMDRRGFLNSFMRLRDKYGDVFTVHLGPRPVVMLYGTEAIREALVDQAEAFSGRGTIAVVKPIFKDYGVIFANGERWKALRRFSLATMRDFGMGKRSVEERIQEETQCLVEELRKSQGAPLNPTFLFQCITANIICSIVFGERFDYKDRQFLRLLDLFYQIFSLISSFSSQVFELFSGFLKYFPGAHKQISRNLKEVLDYIDHSVQKHRSTLDPSKKARRTMEPSVLLLLAFFAGFLLLLVRGYPKARGHLPPGPRPLPLLGNLLQMDRRGFLNSFMRLRDKYGDVFTVHLGPRPVVMLYGTEAIREALVDQAEAFSGRGTIAVVKPIFKDYGVIFANGERWKALRRFSLATMRDFGMGKRSVEERIQEETQCLVEELRKSQGAPLNPTFLFQCITANIICSIVFGERFDYKDRQFLRLLDLFYQIFSLISSFSSQVFELFSGFLKYFPGAHKQISRNLKEVLDYIDHSVQKHRSTLDPSNPRDFIDTYLLRMEKEKSNPHTEFHHQNLIISVLSLFFAGTETSSTTLRYGFLLMLKYPHVAEKVQKEIDQVIGSHRLPTLDDRSKMPYTDAVIHEIQRFADLVPIGAPHKVTKDTLFRGYLLPKDTEVYPILSSALHDPRYFEEPDTFNPGHFLDANGALKKNEAFMPFSLGKRICLGEGIARNELFLFFTTLLQNFSLSSPVDPKDIDLSPKESGFGRVPPEYQICFLSR